MTRDFSTADAIAAVERTIPDGFVAEGEIPAQRHDGSANPQAQNWGELAIALDHIDCDKAVATSWAPFQTWTVNAQGQRVLVPAPELARPLITRGWKVMPYVYPAETLTHTVAGAVSYARNFTHEVAPTILDPGEGWYQPEPVLGVYGGKTLDSPEFDGKEECAGFSIWDAGEEF